MFCYLVPQAKEFTDRQKVIWQKSQCGICVSFKKHAKSAKLCLNSDFVFLNIFLHDLLGKEQECKKKMCLFGGIKKVDFCMPDAISEKIAKLGVILLYLMPQSKYYDNGKRKIDVIRGTALKRAYKKCANDEQEFTGKINEQILNLNDLKDKGETDLNKISMPAGNMFKLIINYFVKDSEGSNVEELFFHMGKWCYLMSVIDTIKQDFKNGTFNPLLVNKNFQGNKLQFVVMNRKTLEPVLNDIANNIKKCLYKVTLKNDCGVTKNVLILSIQSFLKTLFVD